MQKVSTLINNVIDTSYGPAISLNLLLKKSWDDIVGIELKSLTSFLDAKYIGKNSISVSAKILSSASLIAKYNENNIISNIKRLTSIADVKLHFKHTNSVNLITQEEFTAKQHIEKAIQKIELEFKNTALKSALENLKTEIQNAA